MRATVTTCALALLLAITACGRGARVAPETEPARPAGVTAALVSLGDSLFNAGSCQRCHGAKGVGGQNGPSLLTGAWLHHAGSFDDIVETITTGVPRERLKDPTRRFAMNARGGPMNLSDGQVRAVAAYVWSISRDKR